MNYVISMKMSRIDRWSQIGQCSYLWHFSGGRVYVCGLLVLKKEVYIHLNDTYVTIKHLCFLEWWKAPELWCARNRNTTLVVYSIGYLCWIPAECIIFLLYCLLVLHFANCLWGAYNDVCQVCVITCSRFKTSNLCCSLGSMLANYLHDQAWTLKRLAKSVLIQL